MPAVINMAASAMLGVAFGMVARRSPSMRRDFLSWPLFFLMGFQALIFTPVATYLFRFYPQWSMFYLLDPQIYPWIDRIVGILSAAAIVLNIAFSLLGYHFARRAVLEARPRLAGTVVGISLFVIMAAAVSFGSRIAFMGDYDQYWQGEAVIFIKKLGGCVGLGSYVLAFVFALWVHSRFAEKDPTLF